MIDLWHKHGANESSAYEAEARSMAKLICSSTGKNLVRLFFLQNKLKSQFKKINAEIKKNDGSLIITGNNLQRIQRENIELNFGNSGTSMRLMMGILSAQKFSSTLTGDESLTQRPMNRVSKPLIKIGFTIKADLFVLILDSLSIKDP